PETETLPVSWEASTLVTQLISPTSSFTDISQCPQVMPSTVLSLVFAAMVGSFRRFGSGTVLEVSLSLFNLYVLRVCVNRTSLMNSGIRVSPDPGSHKGQNIRPIQASVVPRYI